MSTRYKHRFIIPVVVLSLAGTVAAVIKCIMTGTVVPSDIWVAAASLLGIAIVCTGRRRAYRRIAFRNFIISDHVRYWLLLKLSCSCIVIGLLDVVAPAVRIAAVFAYLVFTVLERAVLVQVKRRNAYSCSCSQNASSLFI